MGDAPFAASDPPRGPSTSVDSRARPPPSDSPTTTSAGADSATISETGASPLDGRLCRFAQIALT